MRTETIPDTASMASFARVFASTLVPTPSRATVLALSGDLGAGKTTFTQALAQSLGVVESVVSPTFVVMRRYRIPEGAFQHLIHIDAYRIEDDSELNVLKLQDLFNNPDNLIVIEWPERIISSIPEDAHRLAFGHTGEGSREVTMA